ncbi:unnamed protein product [Zymoseptoria tritici ST99CH_1A5]|uniref:Stress response RCI peptide n=1 Tax=Zymoseptoria tritici ST99CH_1A5 TaxID=1276529 RepID=A0A1Y6LFJ3_ZYMTR|nr:unnamed protein product [Zymoseptoria tritici ST99CH_1A5]
MAICYRIGITLLNIFCPPFAVAMLTGLNYDCMLNCIFFLLAVIPSHVHGFYVSCVYFHRRKKARKGKYPGGPKPMLYSRDLLNGGLSNKEVERRWVVEQSLNRKGSRRSSRKRNRRSKSVSRA